MKYTPEKKEAMVSASCDAFIKVGDKIPPEGLKVKTQPWSKPNATGLLLSDKRTVVSGNEALITKTRYNTLRRVAERWTLAD